MVDAGSSPRVRGTGFFSCRHYSLLRFIPACAGNSIPVRACVPPSTVHPACAGNSYCTRSVIPGQTVHPRVCGEQSRVAISLTRDTGSSPRVRGTVFLFLREWVRLRFIPACAGNSLDEVSTTTAPAVHPRVCGEQIAIGIRQGIEAGSSPRVRGTALFFTICLVTVRFIPACAGNRCQRRS